MTIRLLFLFSLLFIPFSQVSAQYTDIINANRPGLSQSAFSVGRDVIQVETGFSYGKEKHKLLFTETDALGVDYTIRYGILAEQLEFSIMGEFQGNSIYYTEFQPTSKIRVSDFKSNTIGAKYLFYDPSVKRSKKAPNLYSWRANNEFEWYDLVPAVSAYVGVNVHIGNENPFMPQGIGDISPKVVISTQNNITRWVLVTNIIADRVTSSVPAFGYIVTLTHATHTHFSLFLENQGMKSDFHSDQLLRGGAAALITPNFQVDLSATYSLKDTPSMFYARLGLAYRLDMHYKDDYIEDMLPLPTPEKDKKEKKVKKEKLEKELEVGDEK